MRLFRRIGKFLHDIRVELKKVHWPTRREFAVFTGIVLATVIVIGLFFFGLDSVFIRLVRLVTGV